MRFTCAMVLVAVLVAACSRSYSGLAGTWESRKPAVGEEEIVTTLQLFADGEAQISSVSEKTVAIVMKGSWRQSGNQRVVATFTERNAPKLESPVTMTFQLEGSRLQLLGEDGQPAGAPFIRR
jgi:hypothetical protein